NRDSLFTFYFSRSSLPPDPVPTHRPPFRPALLLDHADISRTAHLQRPLVPADYGHAVGGTERVGVEGGEHARGRAGRRVLAATRLVIERVDLRRLGEEGLRVTGG